MIHFIQNKHFVAKLLFLFYLFFAVFGTSMPFRDKITDPELISNSNFLNQFVYSITFIISAYILSDRWKEMFIIIKREKFLFVFLFWCVFSILWSEFSFVSFKRVFQLITVVAVSLAFLLNTDSTTERLFCFKLIFFIYVVISAISIILIPEASHEYGAWRGLAAQKNQLGQVALVSLMFWFYSFCSVNSRQKMQAFVLMVISLALIVGSKSMTSLMTLFLLASIWGVCFVNSKLKNSISIGNSFLFLVLFFVFAVGGVTLFFAPELLAVLPEHLGKDSSLTGRTYLWADVFALTKQHLLFGCGFGGFWVIDNPDLMTLYEKYYFLPNTAHMGYLDVLNETGLVGISIIFLMLTAYFKNLEKFLQLKELQIWIWFVVAALVVNLTESILFNPWALTGKMFIFSYLALYVDLIIKNTDFKTISTR